MIICDAPQGSEQWLLDRAGVITGSRFRDCRERLKSGKPSAKATTYARDVARERVTGKPVPGPFVNAAMRFGIEQEPLARMAYELRTGYLVEASGFITTDDRKFGVSVDGLIGDDGGFECKTLVSSDTLFDVLCDDGIDDYIDQCQGAMWALGRKWWDLVLWAPDLECIGRHLTIHRLHRDEAYIDALEEDLVAFERIVSSNVDALLKPVVDAQRLAA